MGIRLAKLSILIISLFKMCLFYKNISSAVLLSVLMAFFSQQISVAQSKKYTVVLDAGHGGHDPGKIGYKGYREKDIALSLVLRIGKQLKKNPRIKVIYTRTKDVFVDLWARGRIANKAKADLFVSVHCNAHHSQAIGAETWVLSEKGNKKNFDVAQSENKVILLEKDYKKQYKGFDPNSLENNVVLTMEQEQNTDLSIFFADLVQKNLQQQLKRVNRGVKQNYFVVLHQTYMPSVLIETGFITNRREGSYLKSNRGKAQIATQIADAIATYFDLINKDTVADVVPAKKTEKQKQQISGQSQKYFALQIAAGRKKISTKPHNFKGLKDVFVIKKDDELYRYYTCKSKDKKTTERCAQSVKKKYKKAFIVAL